MESIQINGQKIWGPPKDWKGPPPPHGTEIFIKNIPDDVFEDELYYLFSTIGRVYEVRLPVYWTGKNKGYAFVRYTNISEADKAIEKLNKCTIRESRSLKVERSLDNARLFLSSVPNDKTGEEIKTDLLTVVENVKTVYVYPALENPDLYRGYAFVEFQCHRDAAIAKRILTPDVLFDLFNRKCMAAWANPLPFLNKETLKSINILFMRNIPSNVKSISIKMALDTLLAPDMVHKVKRLNDYAFLTFKNHDMAERAMIKLKCNPFLLGEKAIHIEWAIPRELAGSMSPTKTSMTLNVLPPLNLKTDPQPYFNTCDAFSYSPKTGENLYQYQADVRKNVSETYQRLLTEFLSPDCEDSYRSLHLKNWIRSLTPSDQQSTCRTSPNSLSTSSSSLSWKCEEINGQFANGWGASAGYDACHTGTLQQLYFF